MLLRRDSSGAALDFVNGTTGPEKLLQSGVGGDLYFLQDHLSSVIALANGMGSLVEQESYEPFGNTSGSSSLTDYGYIGGRLDPDTRLLFLNSRFYDPASQRFITEDPIGVAGGTNVFAYANNDPVNLFDPTGLSADNSDTLYQIGMGFVSAGDHVSGGLTNWIRDQLGTNDVVDKCSFGYQVGGYVGDAINYSILALSGAQLVRTGITLLEALQALDTVESATSALAEATETAEQAISETCGACFPAGTLVHTRKGKVRIEAIKVGDEVLSRNQGTGKLEYKKVTALTRPHLDRILEVIIQGEQAPLRVTPSHPFWVSRGGKESWVNSEKMRVDDLVLSVTRGWLKVREIRSLGREELVYNFEVSDNHDYFVTIDGFLVHNPACNINTLMSYASQIGADIEQFSPAIFDGPPGMYGATLLSDAGEITINIAEDAFESEQTLVQTIAHEYTHALQYSNALAAGGLEVSGEAITAFEAEAVASEAPAWQAFLNGVPFF